MQQMIEFKCTKCMTWRRTFSLAVLSKMWTEPPYTVGPYCANCASNEHVQIIVPWKLQGMLLIWSEKEI